MSDRLGYIFLMLVDRYSRRGNWRGYSYVDEMRGHALQQLSQIGLQFDELKSDNPFAFYTTAAATDSPASSTWKRRIRASPTTFWSSQAQHHPIPGRSRANLTSAQNSRTRSRCLPSGGANRPPSVPRWRRPRRKVSTNCQIDLRNPRAEMVRGRVMAIRI